MSFCAAFSLAPPPRSMLKYNAFATLCEQNFGIQHWNGGGGGASLGVNLKFIIFTAFRRQILNIYGWGVIMVLTRMEVGEAMTIGRCYQRVDEVRLAMESYNGTADLNNNKRTTSGLCPSRHPGSKSRRTQRTWYSNNTNEQCCNINFSRSRTGIEEKNIRWNVHIFPTLIWGRGSGLLFLGTMGTKYVNLG